MTQTNEVIHEQFAMPEYLVFLILGHIKELRKVAPDHILVKAVTSALEQEPEQLEIDFNHSP